MEVDKLSFYPLLLDILTDISESHFVAIDLELSGVCSKTAGLNTRRPTLQERYLEVKEAAERYQILQFGLTCVQKDVENQQYVLKPYNFEICPIIEERGLNNDIERIFSYQSGAVEFLLKVGFDMAKPFTDGVPYLSRAEAREARDKYDKKQDKSNISDIHLKQTDIKSLAFVKRVRRDIDDFLWANNSDTLIIESTRASEPTSHVTDLSRFEKRLVHQLVRAEYPELVAMSKRNCIQLVKFDKEREDRYAAERKQELEERINRQKGFRWVIDALLGSASVANLDVKECARDPTTGEPVFADLAHYGAQFHRACARIRGNPRMIVGHNCFLDMVYIYRTFLGPLPDTVEEFTDALHKHWPMVVDTKYMSTHNCGDISPISSLEQIAQQLSAEEVPLVTVDSHHKKYNDIEAFHEAGFDSFLTAQIAIRLSAKLKRTNPAFDEPPATAETFQFSQKPLQPASERLATAFSALRMVPSSISQAFGFSADDNGTPDSHDTISGLSSSSNGATFVPSDPNFRWKGRGDPSLGPCAGDDEFGIQPGSLTHHHKFDLDAEGTVEGGMPRMDSQFWKLYGNKFRVFGTEETVCVIADDNTVAISPDEDGEGGVTVEVN